MITKINKELSEKITIQIEEYIRLSIKPRPKWLPEFIWKKILKRLLVVGLYKRY